MSINGQPIKKMSQLYGPCGVFVSNGEVYIADTENNRVRKLLRNGQIVTITGVEDSMSNQDDQSTTLKNPSSVVVSSSNQVYISEWYDHRIRKIDQNGVMSIIAGNENGLYGYNGDGQLAVTLLTNPCGMFVTDDEEVLFCDSGIHLVRKIDGNGDVITTIAGLTGYQEYISKAITCLNYPTSVFQYKHDIYIADTGNNQVKKMDRHGVMTVIAGNGLRKTSSSDDDSQVYIADSDNILATQASICPQCVFVHNDHIYISDKYNHQVRKVLPNGIITTVAGTGEKGYNGDDQLATKASLSYPMGIFVDDDSQVYIADSDNHCIRKVDKNGMISTIAGTPGESGCSGDVPFDFDKYPHVGPKRKQWIKPFPQAYHDIVITCNDFNSTTTWTEYGPLSKKTKFN